MPRIPEPSLDPLPDAALLRRVARRDSTALNELQRRHGPSLYAIAYAILMDAQRAEQVVVDVFEQAWFDALRATGPHGPGAWLRRMTKERAQQFRSAPSLA